MPQLNVEFWRMADELQDRTIEHAGGLYAFVEKATPTQLITLLTQYRFFTAYYVPELALLVARLKSGKLRSFLGDVLSDELGYGDQAKAHYQLYDDFLGSLYEVAGVDVGDMDALAIKNNLDILDGIRAKFIDSRVSAAYCVGLRGMGGECVCQIYLARLHEHLQKNPFIQSNKDRIHWVFWELHIGDHDIQHRLNTRKLIDEEMTGMSEQERFDLAHGYHESMTTWAVFWENIFKSAQSSVVERSIVTGDVIFRTGSDPSLSMKAGGALIRQFHLAIPVHDLEQGRIFYRDVLGANEGRSTANHIDFDFYGHHLVIHIAPEDAPHLFASFPSDFHGETVKVPHFGMNLDRDVWRELADRIESHDYDFFDPPHVRMSGEPGEHASMFVIDPSGNALEFKYFRNHDEVFSKVFDPATKDMSSIEKPREAALPA